MVIPCIEIMDGRCVSLHRGNTDQPMVWQVDPVSKAREFAAAGAEWMHLTDFDSLQESATNHELKLEIIRQAGIPVQLGGGLRSQAQIEEWIDLGAGRIVISTLATMNPTLVKSVAKYHPDQIVVAIEIWKERVLIHGWTSPSAITPLEFVREYRNVPLAGIMITDIDADIEDQDRNLDRLAMLAAECTSPVIASGVIMTAQDVMALKSIPNVSSVIVGTAIFRKNVDLGEILELAAE